MNRISEYQTSAATSPAAGMVRIQANTILRAMPQRTALLRFNDPTPRIAPVMVCVVETGIPKNVAKNKVNALALSAQNPETGFNLVIFIPMVLTIRQPPKKVPNAITKLHETTIHHGT